jgi:hypothetical protein
MPLMFISTNYSTSPKSLFYTSFDNINTNIFHNSLDLLLYKRRGSFVNPIHALSVLSSQSGRRSHGIAAMCRNDFLIGFEAPARFASARCVFKISKRKSVSRRRSTHAPPELSDPAITRIRFMIDDGSGLCGSMFRWQFESWSCLRLNVGISGHV